MIFLISVIIILNSNCYAQVETIKPGAYRNSVDFNNNKPLYELKFNFHKKNHKKVPELYDIATEDVEYDPISDNYSIWGIYDGTYFYLNAKRLDMVNGFIRMKISGQYAYFKGRPVKSLQQKARLTNSAMVFGLTSAAIATTSVAIENKDRVHYVLNFKTGMVNLLTDDYIMRILEPYSELMLAFQNEYDKNSLEVLQKYIGLVNERITNH